MQGNAKAQKIGQFVAGILSDLLQGLDFARYTAETGFPTAPANNNNE
jgi:hypothetical protein